MSNRYPHLKGRVILSGLIIGVALIA